jgi:hypothetical protein
MPVSSNDDIRERKEFSVILAGNHELVDCAIRKEAETVIM